MCTYGSDFLVIKIKKVENGYGTTDIDVGPRPVVGRRFACVNRIISNISFCRN